MQFRITWKRCVLVAVVVIVALIGIEATLWLRPPPKLVVGRDTTWLTGPLDANGNVDYDAAWRAEHSPGVTAENNAAPLVYAAMGWDLSTFTAEERAAAPKVERPFEEFGFSRSYAGKLVAPADPKGDAEDEARLSLDAGDSHGRQERAIAAWFDSIEPSLAVLQEASARERFYASDGAPRSKASIRYWNVMEAAHAFARRAHRSANGGDLDGASRDLCCVLRLARLLRSMDGFLHFTIATGCESYFCDVASALASDHAQVSPSWVRRVFEAREERRPDSMIDAWLVSNRIFGLSVFDYLRQQAVFGSLRLFSRLDPNRFNRRVSGWSDRVDAVWTDARGWCARLEEANSTLKEVRRLKRSTAEKLTIGMFLRGPDAVTDWVADDFAGIDQLSRAGYIEEFVGDIAQEDRFLAEMAAAAFAKEVGRDPKSSDDLSPFVFPKPFRDRLTNSGVTFVRDERGRLVAIGPIVDVLTKLEAIKRESKP